MAVSEDNPQNRLAWAETRGELVRVGDRIVVQAIPFQSEEVIKAMTKSGIVILDLQGGGARNLRPDNPVLRLAAREDTERPACPICGTHEWIPDVGCRRCAEGGAKGCGQCWTCKAHQEGLYGDVECETRFEGRIRAMRDERKRTCQANAPLCVHGEWPSQCPHPDCPGLQNPPDETIALAARGDTERPEERLRGALNAVCRAYHDMAHTPSRSYDHCIEVMCANVRQLLRDTERPDSACTCLIKAPPGSFEHVPDCPAAEQEHEG